MATYLSELRRLLNLAGHGERVDPKPGTLALLGCPHPQQSRWRRHMDGDPLTCNGCTRYCRSRNPELFAIRPRKDQ